MIVMVPGSVTSVSSVMGTTWAIISWTKPTYIPALYPVIAYEIGYKESEECVYPQRITNYVYINVSSDTYTKNIDALSYSTCYVFVVRGYTSNGHGPWNGVVDSTLLDPSTQTLTVIEVSITVGAIGAAALLIIVIIVYFSVQYIR